MSLVAYDLPFRDLIDAAPDGVIVCDHAVIIVLVNAETERMFGYGRDELIGQRIDILVPDRARAQHGQHVAGYTGALRLRPMGIGMELTGRRAGQETGPIEGTGIGLTITRRLAEMMKGRVGFTSEVDRGSAFWVEMPIHRRPTAEIAPTKPIHTASPLAAGEPRHKVIYIEDNPSNIAFMHDLIEDLPSVELVTAPTAEIGIELVRSHRPQVVIMDINLPGMSGFDAVQKLRERPETRSIPVIGLSAAALLKDTTRAKDAGFYRYLTKPVKVAELTRTLEELLVGPPG